MLAIPAFSMFCAGGWHGPGGDGEYPHHRRIEFDTPETDSSLSPEDTADTEDGASKEDTEETEASADTAAILSELLGKLNITATENGVQITSGDADGQCGQPDRHGNDRRQQLKVRTGAGTENPAITQRPTAHRLR